VKFMIKEEKWWKEKRVLIITHFWKPELARIIQCIKKKTWFHRILDGKLRFQLESNYTTLMLKGRRLSCQIRVRLIKRRTKKVYEKSLIRRFDMKIAEDSPSE
jgi:hypothetical protein